MVLHCPVLSCMVLYGSLWSNKDPHGPIWSCVDQHGPVCSCLVLYGPVLSLLVLYGLLWSCMVPFSSVCSSMDQYGPVWSCMVPYGVVKLKSSSLVMTQLWVIISFNFSPDECLRTLIRRERVKYAQQRKFAISAIFLHSKH